MLVKGMCSKGMSGPVLSVRCGWVLEPRVLGAAPGARCTRRRRGKGVQDVPRSHRLPWAEVGGIFLQGSTPRWQSPILGTGCAQCLASSPWLFG